MTATIPFHGRNLTLSESIAQSLGLLGDGEVQAEMTNEGLLIKPHSAVSTRIYTEEEIDHFEDESDLEPYRELLGKELAKIPANKLRWK